MPPSLKDWIDELIFLITKWKIEEQVLAAVYRHLWERGRIDVMTPFVFHAGLSGVVDLGRRHYVRRLTPREWTWLVQDVRAAAQGMTSEDAVPWMLTTEEYETLQRYVRG